MKKGIFILLIVALVILISGMAHGQYFYYYPDGSQHYLEVYDTLVAVGFRSVVEPEADMYAIEHSYLQNYFDFKQMPGEFTIFGR